MNHLKPARVLQGDGVELARLAAEAALLTRPLMLNLCLAVAKAGFFIYHNIIRSYFWYTWVVLCVLGGLCGSTVCTVLHKEI